MIDADPVAHLIPRQRRRRRLRGGGAHPGDLILELGGFRPMRSVVSISLEEGSCSEQFLYNFQAFGTLARYWEGLEGLKPVSLGSDGWWRGDRWAAGLKWV